MDLTVSLHAIQRYQERVENLPDETVRQILSSPHIKAAAAFGAKFIRIASGHRIAIADMTVTTILPPDNYRRQIRRVGVPRFNNGRARRERGDEA